MDPEPSATFSYFLSIINAHFEIDVLLWIPVAILLLLLSAITSGYEVAFFSLDASRWKELENEVESDSFAAINKLGTNPKKLLATLLVAICFINLGNIILMEYLLHSIFHFDNSTLEFIFKLIIEASLLLLFAEILPIIFANHENKWVVKTFHPLITFFDKLFFPIVYLMSVPSNFLEKKLKIFAHDSLSLEEIDHAIDLTVEVESQNKQEINILKGIVKFGNITVSEIMQPRLDVIALNDTLDFTTMMQTVRQSGYSRIPVYHEDLDQIKGVIYTKDLIAHIQKEKDFAWQSLIREPIFVPQTRKIDDVLNMFKSKRSHLAVVINEYGGTEGIVTLEDVLEVVIGDIRDEFDDEQIYNFKRINDTTFTFNARTPMHEFCKIFDISRDYFEEASEEADSLAGVLLELFQKIPTVQDTIEYKNFIFNIDKMDKHRIDKVRVQVNTSQSIL